MEMSELAEILNDRFDRLERRMEGLYEAQGHFSECCRERHTEIDREVERLKQRGGILSVVASAVAVGVSAALLLIKELLGR